MGAKHDEPVIAPGCRSGRTTDQIDDAGHAADQIDDAGRDPGLGPGNGGTEHTEASPDAPHGHASSLDVRGRSDDRAAEQGRARPHPGRRTAADACARPGSGLGRTPAATGADALNRRSIADMTQGGFGPLADSCVSMSTQFWIGDIS
jgi:hypothetical protein